MHKDLADPSKLTDSMRMFTMGLEGGKPRKSETGCQPEWFYKGDGSQPSRSGQSTCPVPTFALDGGEEPEIVGIYLIGPAGFASIVVGFALGNEFSRPRDRTRTTICGSRIRSSRPASVGPELLVGDRPPTSMACRASARGEGRLWEKPFLSGEANMCAFRSPISRRTISNMRCFAAPATFTSISSAPPRCRSAMA